MAASSSHSLPSPSSDVGVGQPFYISTAINYANGPPHMGHAYEAIIADCLARYHRQYGRDLFFMTGTDEHGQKIATAAEQEGVRPRELTDRYSAQFQELNKQLGISNDRYIRTTEPEHYETVQHIWRKSAASGDIYLDTYNGWYNVREEAFLSEVEAKNANFQDPATGRPLEKRSEESYFFRLKNYWDKIHAHIKEHPGFVQPESARQEILARLSNDEARDLSVSRCSFDWGVPVPAGDGQAPVTERPHVMYVWFDALPNYLSGIKYPVAHSKYWPANVHLIGKDINWFHSVIWPSMLMSIGESLPRQVFCHGFVLAQDGRKMGKSLGNAVDPREIIDKYGVDAFRYFLLRETPVGEDLIFSERRLVELSNADLLKSFGNLLHRATNLCKQSCNGQICTAERLAGDQLPFDAAEFIAETDQAYLSVGIYRALSLLMEKIHRTNQWITELAPWAIKDPEQLGRKQAIIVTLLELLYFFAHFLLPAVPAGAQRVFERFNTPAQLISQLSPDFKNIPVGTPITVGPVLYTELEYKLLPVQELGITVGRVATAAPHPDAEKLYVLSVDFGSFTRQVVAGLRDYYTIEQLQGRHVVALTNLKPSRIRNCASEAMLLCSEHVDDSQRLTVQLLAPPPAAQPGATVQARGLAPSADKQIRVQDFQRIVFSVKDGQVIADSFPLVVGSDPICTSAPDGAKIR